MKKKTISTLLALLLLAAYVIFGGGDVQHDPVQTSTTTVQQSDVQAELPPDEAQASEEVAEDDRAPAAPSLIDEEGSYTTAEDIALYIHTYGHLPKNFVTKDEAREAGWSGGGLEDYLPGMCIGGDHFGNYEGLLPKAKGRKWTECDVNTLGKDSRGAERIIFSNDGLIYYTADHYDSFQLLYE